MVRNTSHHVSYLDHWADQNGKSLLVRCVELPLRVLEAAPSLKAGSSVWVLLLFSATSMCWSCKLGRGCAHPQGDHKIVCVHEAYGERLSISFPTKCYVESLFPLHWISASFLEKQMVTERAVGVELRKKMCVLLSHHRVSLMITFKISCWSLNKIFWTVFLLVPV